MNVLKLYNSLTGRKEDFKPIDPGHVRVYACGPTVYNYAHIGNARMAVVFDLLVRVLRHQYPKVTYVSNITDVDDKIMAAAAETGEPINAITEKYTHIYNEDMAALGVLPPDVQPRATTHIPEMIALIEKLIAAGHAYAAEGHVLFNVPSFPAYGGLSGRSRDDQIAGARVEVSPFKKDPADFVLWKPSTGDQVGWDSPWGYGRPGWHIECSAMAEKHLGLPFDIHGGGADLKFPHHENEIAQSCCAHGHENDLSAFAKYWVHNGFVTVEGEKMSKSLGNTVLAHEMLEKGISGEVIRLALLSAHYRQPLDWSENLIYRTKAFLDSMYRVLYELKDLPVADFPTDETFPVSLSGNVIAPLLDDLNTPEAVSNLSFLRGAVSGLIHELKVDLAKPHKDYLLRFLPGYKKLFLEFGNFLGVLQQDPAKWLGYDQSGEDSAAIEFLLAERQSAKKDKNFARADEIRKQLEADGIVIEDTPAGPKWRRA